MNDVQRKELDVYEEVAEICDRHNLRYFAIGGTCIGAVRHNGFIPWDDDIDVGMPRYDYEEFLRICKTELPSYLEVLDCERESQFPYLFAKIHDSRTTLIGLGFNGNPSLYTGAFIDIMPIDGLPVGRERERVLRRVSNYGWLHYKSRKLATNGTGMRSFAMRVARACLSKVFSKTNFPKMVKNLLEGYSFDASEECIFTWRAYDKSLPVNRLVFPKIWFEETETVKFEDTMMPIPHKVDEYLTSDFGNYMCLPSQEERRSAHDIVIADMNCSYKTYQ